MIKRQLIAFLESLIVWLEGPPPKRAPSHGGSPEDDAIESFLRSVDLLETE